MPGTLLTYSQHYFLPASHEPRRSKTLSSGTAEWRVRGHFAYEWKWQDLDVYNEPTARSFPNVLVASKQF